MPTVCTFKSYVTAPNSITTESSGTLSLNDVLVDQPTGPGNPQTAISISSNTLANPSVVTTAQAHGCSTGDHVLIQGSNSTPSIDGDQAVTVTGATTFTVAVNVSVAGTRGKMNRTSATVTANLQPRIYVSAANALTAGVAQGWYQKVGATEYRKM